MNIPRPMIVVAAAVLSMAALSQAAAAQQKTRQEVRQELVRARHDGVIPARITTTRRAPAAVARNQEIHRATVHRGEMAPLVDAHDNRFAVR